MWQLAATSPPLSNGCHQKKLSKAKVKFTSLGISNEYDAELALALFAGV